MLDAQWEEGTPVKDGAFALTGEEFSRENQPQFIITSRQMLSKEAKGSEHDLVFSMKWLAFSIMNRLFSILSRVFSILREVFSILSGLFSILREVFSILREVFSILREVFSILNGSYGKNISSSISRQRALLTVR
jgi:hypothetical protein